MPTSGASRHEAARLIKEACAAFLSGPAHPALHGHEVDADAKAVLERLGGLGRNSDRLTAAEAITSALPPEAWSILLADCIFAEWRSRKHPEWNGVAQTTLDQANEAQKALDEIKKFVYKPHAGASNIFDPVEDALRVLHSEIAMRQRLANEHLQLFSRKKTVDACRAIGVAWIRDSLTFCCQEYGGSAEPRYVSAIATAALNLGDVTEDAARKTVPLPDRLRAMRGLPARSGVRN